MRGKILTEIGLYEEIVLYFLKNFRKTVRGKLGKFFCCVASIS
jgi:hypothetical protein